MTSPDHRLRRWRWQAFPIAAGLGLFWLWVELADALLADRATRGLESLRGIASAIPWQVGFFLLLAVPAFALRLGWRASGSLVLGLAGFAFFGSRVGEGLLKNDGETLLSVAGWIAAAVAIGVSPAAIAWMGRVLPRRIAVGWVPAVWAAWIAIGVPTLDRASPILGFARVPSASTLLDATVWVSGLLVFAIVLLVAALPRAWPLALLPFVGPWIGQAVLSPTPPAARSGSPRPNVILVVVDTLRADHAPIPDDSPALEAFYSESVRFETAIAPGNHTLSSMPGVMTSLPVSAVGQKISPQAVTLAEALRDAGYSTIGVSANPLVSERTGYDQGFGRFSDSYDWTSYQIGDLRRVAGVLAPSATYRLGISSSEFYYRPASDIRRRAIRLALAAPRPLFLYVHTMDMHGPYLPERRLLDAGYRDGDFLSYFSFLRLDRETVLGESERLRRQIENLQQRYAGELRFTDAQLGLFFEALREAGLWEESLIWVVSDHGESFGERGFVGHGGWNTTPSVQRVPMALKLPASWQVDRTTVRDTVSTFDVLPTTLSLLGLPPPSVSVGTDLEPWIRGGSGKRVIPVVSAAGGMRDRTLSVFDGPWQLDVRMLPSGIIEGRTLYNLATDPEQRVDVARAHPGAVRRLERKLEGFIKLERRAMFQAQQTQFDERTRQQLRRLGYIE